ncbi:DNA primase [Buchananella felis]|uniref:DNA primase n=1 Tax=Buchananella felis TaxID=3231492 RepID=UPI003527B099
MAGLIKREDIDAVRERADIAEIVGTHVTLKSAGVGSMKGLCPFHDERTPSFHVRPQLGYWHCFGCGEGGDVISFLQRMDRVSFTEAVELLAAKYGVELHYEDGAPGPARSPEEPGRRQRLLDAHRIAEEFYQAQLASPRAGAGRQFLASRGFDRGAARHFGVGYSPPAWDELLRVLRSRGFRDDEIVTAGLATQGPRGIYDRFRGRLMWPIRDLTGATIGFGARKLGDEEGPKYLNTPETPLYKKNQVLYGVDLAKRDIAAKRRLVVVEGYTDVMAAHLAGETTAVATCGTAFGEGHIRVARRLLGDSFDPAAGVIFSTGATHGAEVIFTFDGDAAGRKAALRAFEQDQKFAAQTFVAVEPSGKDPCDVRCERGDAAVRELIESRRPLFEFAIDSVLAGLDVTTAEGRVAGMRVVAPVIAQIRDRALRGEYARETAGKLGIDERALRQAVQRAERDAAGRARPDRYGGHEGGRFAGAPGSHGLPGSHGGAGVPGSHGAPGSHGGAGAPGGEGGGSQVGAAGGTSSGYGEVDAVSMSGGSMNQAELRELVTQWSSDPAARTERQGMEAVLLSPSAAAEMGFDELPGNVFTVPALRSLHESIRAAGGVGSAAQYPHLGAWMRQVTEYVEPYLVGLLHMLSVAAVPVADEKDVDKYVRGVVGALMRAWIVRRIGDLRQQLRRLPAESEQAHAAMAELMKLETRRRQLMEQT